MIGTAGIGVGGGAHDLGPRRETRRPRPAGLDRRARASSRCRTPPRSSSPSPARSRCRRGCWAPVPPDEFSGQARESPRQARRRTRWAEAMRQGRLRAIASMLAAVAAFSGMDALLKLLRRQLPADGGGGAARGGRTAVHAGAGAAVRALAGPEAAALRMHLARGALAVVVLGGFIYAVRALSLANAYAVFLSAPLIMTALSVPILKERTEPAGWLAITVGLLGRAHHAAPERLGAGLPRLAGGAGLGHRLRRERHHGAGADAHRQHRERGGVDRRAS